MTNEIDINKPYFIGSCILHAVILLGLIFSISLSGSGMPSASQPNIIQATAVSSSALQQYQNAIIQKQQALLAQQQAAQLAAQKAAAQAAAQAAAEKLSAEKAAQAAKQAAQQAAEKAAQQAAAAKAAAMKQSIEQQLKASMQKQLAHTPAPKVATSSKNASTHAATTSKATTSTASSINPGLADKYKAAIIQAISEQWLVPQHLPKNISCVLDIRVAPGGVVLQVTVKKSSGNPVLDNSAVAAVNKASPLPVPTDASLFDAFRTITLTVRPDGSLLEG
ncbi:MAG: cell envelope integrity protein TolA [Gammaproteobacteria bacterium]|nr:cell envelope integrity protein TolA [Gammaproteobacteria bacterium]